MKHLRKIAQETDRLAEAPKIIGLIPQSNYLRRKPGWKTGIVWWAARVSPPAVFPLSVMIHPIPQHGKWALSAKGEEGGNDSRKQPGPMELARRVWIVGGWCQGGSDGWQRAGARIRYLHLLAAGALVNFAFRVLLPPRFARICVHDPNGLCGHSTTPPHIVDLATRAQTTRRYRQEHQDADTPSKKPSVTMKLSHLVGAAFLAASQPALVQAADCVSVALGAIPSCAQSCFLNGAPSIGCAGTDFACQCENEAKLYAAIEGCVSDGCPSASYQAVIDGASTGEHHRFYLPSSPARLGAPIAN